MERCVLANRCPPKSHVCTHRIDTTHLSMFQPEHINNQIGLSGVERCTFWFGTFLFNDIEIVQFKTNKFNSSSMTLEIRERIREQIREPIREQSLHNMLYINHMCCVAICRPQVRNPLPYLFASPFALTCCLCSLLPYGVCRRCTKGD